MTDNEIMRGLQAHMGDFNCNRCTMDPKTGCADKLCAETISLITRLTAENAALREKLPQWVSVEEKRPKPGTRVLATDGVFVGEAYRTSADSWRRYDGIAMRDCLGSVVTHWMPLPGAPEGRQA